MTCTIYCAILQLNYRLCIALYTGKFSSGANQKQSFETIDLENIERHQKPGMDFWCLFLLQKSGIQAKGANTKERRNGIIQKRKYGNRRINMEQKTLD